MNIIAEAGIAHGGDVDQAKLFVKAAQLAGADIIKFATFTADNLVPPKHKTYRFWKKLELTFQEWKSLKKYANKVGIEFMSTPSHPKDVKLLEKLFAERYKIGSDDIDNFPLLQAVADTGKPVFLSTGNASTPEIVDAIYPFTDVTLLHCVSKYPCSPGDLNLHKSFKTLNCLSDKVGYSNHLQMGEDTLLACTSALALGAKTFEIHIKLDNLCIDKNISMYCGDLSDLISELKLVEYMLQGEKPFEIDSRKTLHTRKALKAGERLSLKLLRGKGMSATKLEYYSKKHAKTELAANKPLTIEDVR